MEVHLPALMLLGLLGAVSFILYARLSSRVLRPGGGHVCEERYSLPDAVFTGFLSLFFLFMVVLAARDPGEVGVEAILSGSAFYLSLIVGILGFLVFRGLNPVQLFGLEREGWSRKALLAFGWLLAAYPLILLAQFISYQLASANAAPQELVTFLMDSESWQDKAIVIGLAVVIAPVAEELIFRGYIYGVMKKYGGRIVAILVSSALFAVIHLHAPSLAGLFILAVVLVLVYERTGSLWAPILMHATFNAVSVAAALFWPQMIP